MGESCKNICRKHGVNMYFKGGNTSKDLLVLVHPKDRDTSCKRVELSTGSGVRHRGICRTFVERLESNMKAPSLIHDHHNITGHEVSLDNLSIVGREDQNIARTIKQAILIRVNDPIPEQKHWQIPAATHMG